MIIGKTVGDIRSQRGLSVKDVASFIGIGQTKVRGIERGTEDVRLDQLVALARVLGVTAAELVEQIQRVELDSTEALGQGRRRVLPVQADVELGDTPTTAQRFGASYRSYRRGHQARPLDLVARAAGVPHSTVAYIERGVITPRTSLAVLLADACGVSLSRLLSDAGL